MREKNTIEHCWNIGKNLFDGWNRIVEKYNIDAKMIGYPVRMEAVCFDKQERNSLALKSLLLEGMVKLGIFMAPLGSVYLSYSHSNEDIEKTLSALDEVCSQINSKVTNDEYEKFLEGNMPKKIWTMKIPPTKSHNC